RARERLEIGTGKSRVVAAEGAAQVQDLLGGQEASQKLLECLVVERAGHRKGVGGRADAAGAGSQKAHPVLVRQRAQERAQLLALEKVLAAALEVAPVDLGFGMQLAPDHA